MWCESCWVAWTKPSGTRKSMWIMVTTLSGIYYNISRTMYLFFIFCRFFLFRPLLLAFMHTHIVAWACIVVLKWIEFIIMMGPMTRGMKRQYTGTRTKKTCLVANDSTAQYPEQRKKLCFFDCTWFIRTAWSGFQCKRKRWVARGHNVHVRRTERGNQMKI